MSIYPTYIYRYLAVKKGKFLESREEKLHPTIPLPMSLYLSFKNWTFLKLRGARCTGASPKRYLLPYGLTYVFVLVF
jgi:hypothetical protein